MKNNNTNQKKTLKEVLAEMKEHGYHNDNPELNELIEQDFESIKNVLTLSLKLSLIAGDGPLKSLFMLLVSTGYDLAKWEEHGPLQGRKITPELIQQGRDYINATLAVSKMYQDYTEN